MVPLESPPVTSTVDPLQGTVSPHFIAGYEVVPGRQDTGRDQDRPVELDRLPVRRAAVAVHRDGDRIQVRVRRDPLAAHVLNEDRGGGTAGEPLERGFRVAARRKQPSHGAAGLTRVLEELADAHAQFTPHATAR